MYKAKNMGKQRGAARRAANCGGNRASRELSGRAGRVAAAAR